MLTQRAITLYSFIFYFLGFSSAFATDIYRCKDGKEIMYQAEPCPKEAEQKMIDASTYPQTIEGVHLSPKNKNGKPDDSLSSEKKLVIKRSPDSHFYITGSINGVDVRFLVDTGASLVAIPEQVAATAGLRNELQITSGTADGFVKNYETTIRTLNVENLKFDSVMATIVSGSQALLGMNILKDFEITQKGDELELIYKGK